MNVSFHVPNIGEEEIDEVVATLRSGWLTTGPRTAMFEREFAAYVGAPYALGVNSCTAGLHLALAALGLGPGDEVITTPLTFCATVNTILHVGARPVLADIGEDGNIDPESIRRRITPRTRALMPVHFAGMPCRMKEIWEIARQHRLRVVEDCAHAAGARYGDVPVGGGDPWTGMKSDACAFSFYATKNMTTGEGGMVTTHDQDLAERMKQLCLHGISRDAWDRYSDKGKWYYEVLCAGFKYNLSDILSAIGIHQLRKNDQMTADRARIVSRYRALLSDVPEIELPPDFTDGTHAWHLYVIRLRLDALDIDRAEFIAKLRARGVTASVHFIPIPLHPFFAEYRNRPENQCPNVMALYPRLISLPLYPTMSEEAVEYVADCVKAVARSSRKKFLVAVAHAGGAA